MWGSWTRRWMPCKSRRRAAKRRSIRGHMPIPGWNCRWSSRWYRRSQLWCYSRRLYLPSLRVVPAARPMPVVSSMTVVPAGGKLFRSCPDGFGSRRWRCRVPALGGRDSGIEIENIRHGWSGYEQQAYPSLEARNSTMYILEKLKALQISAMSRHQL